MAKFNLTRVTDEMDDFNWINQIAFYLDENKRELKWGLYGVSATGLILTVRSIHPFKKFWHISKIPSTFFDRKVTLDGTVTSVDIGPPILLRVDHYPIIGRSLRRQKEPGLGVKIHSINIFNNGISWLQYVVLKQPITFTLLKKENGYAHCYVHHQKKNVAEELIKLGFAVVEPIDSELEHNRKYRKFYKNLLKLEENAEKERIGIWGCENEDEVEETRSVASKFRNMFKKSEVI